MPGGQQQVEPILSEEGLALEDYKQQVAAAKTGGGTVLQDTLRAIATNEKFKYSRLLAIGLYTLVETIDASALEDKEGRDALLTELAEGLSLSSDKLLKDLELYRSNLEKMAQAQEVMKDIVEAERKRREQRTQSKAKVHRLHVGFHAALALQPDQQHVAARVEHAHADAT